MFTTHTVSTNKCCTDAVSQYILEVLWYFDGNVTEFN